MKPSREEAEKAVETLLRWAGEDPNREGLKETPKRVVRAYEEFFSGYSLSEKEVLNRVFEECDNYAEPILVKDINFYSHCEHHLVPIVGKVHIAYLPDKKLLGLSKLGRLVDIYSKRLQTQERLTINIADALMQNLKPRGVAVIINAQHMCMSMRGVKKQGSYTTTTNFQGEYANNKELREEFYKIFTIIK